MKRGRRILVGAVAATALALALAGALAVGPALTQEPELLPDLRTKPLDAIQIRERDGRRELRFGNTIVNDGPGPLHLRAVQEDCDGDGDAENDRAAYQMIYVDARGTGRFDPEREHDVTEVFSGCMHHHAEHDHWHFDEFARYELLDAAGGPAGPVRDKVSFCLYDQRRVADDAPPGEFTGCAQDEPQGLTPGWRDRYGPGLAGQSLDITGVADGTYVLRSTADPADRIREADERNNVTSTRIEIRGTEVTPVAGDGG